MTAPPFSCVQPAELAAASGAAREQRVEVDRLAASARRARAARDEALQKPGPAGTPVADVAAEAGEVVAAAAVERQRRLDEGEEVNPGGEGRRRHGRKLDMSRFRF